MHDDDMKVVLETACRKEWEGVNDPPCHPSDEDWNACPVCIRRAIEDAHEEIEQLKAENQKWQEADANGAAMLEERKDLLPNQNRAIAAADALSSLPDEPSMGELEHYTDGTPSREWSVQEDSGNG